MLVGETGEGVGSEEGSLPMGLASTGKGSQCNLGVFFNDDTSGLRFRYGRWSGDHEEVMLRT